MSIPEETPQNIRKTTLHSKFKIDDIHGGRRHSLFNFTINIRHVIMWSKIVCVWPWAQAQYMGQQCWGEQCLARCVASYNTNRNLVRFTEMRVVWLGCANGQIDTDCYLNDDHIRWMCWTWFNIKKQQTRSVATGLPFAWDAVEEVGWCLTLSVWTSPLGKCDRSMLQIYLKAQKTQVCTTLVNDRAE